MTVTIPTWLVNLATNIFYFGALAFVLIIVCSLVVGYFYDKEMRKIDKSKAKRERKPKLTT